MRDYLLGTTFDLKFTTRSGVAVPSTLSGTPSVAAYPDNSNTEITAGITLGVDHDGRVGLNNIRVVATSGNGYLAGSNYALVITAGTSGGISVVGEVVGEFSLQAQIKPQVVDALNVDTYAEPTGVPAATVSLVAKIGRLYQVLRNRITVDSGTGKVQYFDDANAALWEKDFTDAANVYDESEGNAP